MTYTPISSLPAAPDRTQPSTFSTRADALVSALSTFVAETNAAGDYIDGVGTAVDADASAAATSASEAAASAAAASQEAAEWVSGASYTEGDVVWSPVDYNSYRAKTTHSGVATDPSSDTTNWAGLSYTSLTQLGVTASSAELNKLDNATFTTDINGVTTFADGVNEGYTAVTSSAGAATVNCRDGNVFAITLTENTTFTFSNPPTTGTAYGMTLKVVQDTTARTITWPASIDWVAGISPTLSSGSGDVDVFVFFTHDGGTTWYGFIAGQDLN